MQVLKTFDELKEFLNQNKGKTLGFVPTMGALHEGHAQLIKKCASENEISLVSVFVNPIQFLPNEDFQKYPRSEIEDIKMAQNSNATAIFFPSESEIYPVDDIRVLAPKRLANILEGVSRPSHFDGVCSVLAKFFNLIRPTKAYFGKKDTQQLIIVEHLVKSLFLDLQIIACETTRAADGLALSSRNSYLDENELFEACKLYRSLVKAKNLFSGGTIEAKTIKNEMSKILEPLKVDYIAVCDRNLNEIDNLKENESIVLVAAFVGKTRLIDNIWL